MRTMESALGKTMQYLLLVLLSLSFAAWPSSPVHAEETSSAVAVAVEGRAELYPEGGEEPGPIEKDTIVRPWDSVSTLEKGKLLLGWDNGLVVSLGEFSSVLYASDEETAADRPNIQVIEGIARVSPDPASGDKTRQYSIETPLASILPKDPNAFADFIVEVYPPDRTVVTVISGEVIISDPKGNGWKETIVGPCHTASIEEDKGAPVVQSVDTGNLERLILASTIEGTLQADLDQCHPSSGYAESPPRPYYDDYMPSPDYYVDYMDPWDTYPYDEIRFIRRYGNVCVILVPGIGYFHIHIPVFSGWVFDPHAVELYCRYAFVERALFHDHSHLHHLRMRRRELFNMMHVAQRTGRLGLFRKLQRDLDYLNVRTDLASRRIGRMQRRAAQFEQLEKKLGRRLPKGLDLRQAIAESFASRKNLKAAENFRERIRTDINLQDQLAGLGRTELAKVRTAMAAETDPRKRMALRAQLSDIRRNIAAGRVPVPRDDKQLRGLLRKLEKERNPKRQEELREKMLTDLRRNRRGAADRAVTPDGIRALKKDINRLANPDARRTLDRRLSQVEHSVKARERFEGQRKKMEQMAQQAAKETDAGKRSQLLRTMKELATPLAGVAVPGFMQLQQQRRLERQLVKEKDRAKRSSIQQTLEELKKKPPEAARQLLPHPPAASDAAKKLEAQREKMERQLRRQIQDRAEAPDSRLRKQQQRAEEELRKQQQRGDRPKSERRSRQDRLDQLQRTRETEQQQKKQEEERKRAEQRLRDQRERTRRERARPREEDRGPRPPGLDSAKERRNQAEIQRRKQEEEKRQADQLRKRQEEQRQDAERRAREERERVKRAESERKIREEERKQADIQRKRQEELRRDAEKRAKERQERSRREERERKNQERQRSQELRKQQERDRQAAEMKKQQEEEARKQAERARRDQQRKQELRSQQDRDRKAAEMRKRQQEEQRRQAEKVRRDQQRQQELRRQQERDRQAAEIRKRQQQEQRRQAERARREQQRQRELRRQQERDRQAAEIRKRQQEEQKRQAERVRREQQRQQQRLRDEARRQQMPFKPPPDPRSRQKERRR